MLLYCLYNTCVKKLPIYFHNVTKYDGNFNEIMVYTNKTLTHYSYSLLYTMVEPNHRMGIPC